VCSVGSVGESPPSLKLVIPRIVPAPQPPTPPLLASPSLNEHEIAKTTLKTTRNTEKKMFFVQFIFIIIIRHKDTISSNNISPVYVELKLDLQKYIHLKCRAFFPVHVEKKKTKERA